MDLSDLRQAAIEMLRQSSFDAGEFSQQSPQELIHELRVHQAELEMQNEELRRTQLELEESRDRYSHLFDFAPVGYVVIDDADRVVEANLTICKMLDVLRLAFIGQSLSRYVVPEEATRLHRHLKGIAVADRRTSCEVTLRRTDETLLRVRLDSVAVSSARSIAITDLSEKEDLIRAWQESEQRLRSLSQILPMPVAFIDATESYQFNNPAHEDLFKISSTSIAGRQVREVMGDAFYAIAEPHIEYTLEGQASVFRLDLGGGGTERRTFDVHYMPHRDTNDQVIGFHELMFDTATASSKSESARKQRLIEQLQCLSRRQQDIFHLLLNGDSNKTIALRMEISQRTVERERQTVLQLLCVKSINELLLKFAGLADVQPRAN